MYDCLSKPITLRLPDGFGLGDTTSTLDLDFFTLGRVSPRCKYLGLGLPPPPVLMADLPGLAPNSSKIIKQCEKATAQLVSFFISPDEEQKIDWETVVSLRRGRGANEG